MSREIPGGITEVRGPTSLIWECYRSCEVMSLTQSHWRTSIYYSDVVKYFWFTNSSLFFFGYNISVIITVSVLRCLCTTVVTKPASYSWETQAMDGPEDKLLTYSTITWRYLKLCLIFTSPTYWNFKTIVLSVAPKTSLPHVPLYVTIGTFMSSAAMNFFLLLVTL